MCTAILVRLGSIENPNAPDLIELRAPVTSIGRHGKVRLDTSRGKEVSKIHAKIYRRERGDDYVWLIEDNESLNGTFVNGRKIHRVFLMSQDEVVFGGGTIFHMGDAVCSTELAECRYRFYICPPEVQFHPDIDFSATLINSARSGVDLCPICYFPITAAERLPCGHEFCLCCIHEWARSCAKALRPCICPMCRAHFMPSELTSEEGEIKNKVASIWQIEPLLRQIDVKSCRTLRHSNIFTKWTEETSCWFWNCYRAVRSNELRRLVFLHLTHATYKHAMKAKETDLKNAIENLHGKQQATREDMVREVINLIMNAFYRAKVPQEPYTVAFRSRPLRY